MLRDKAYHIGWIAKTHGVYGQLSVVTDMKVSEPDKWPEWIFLEIESGLVPFRTRSDGMIWRDEKHLVIALEDIDSQDLAVKMVGNRLWFPREFKLDVVEHSAAAHPMIGFILHDQQNGEIGEIAEFIDLPNNPLFKILVEEREVLIPAREEWILELDETAKKIVMDLPEGLLDVN